jgi:DNA repair protein RadC
MIVRDMDWAELVPDVVTAEDAFEVLRGFAALPQIHVVVITLDGRNRILSIQVAHMGTDSDYLFSPAIILRIANQEHSHGFVLGITHPWGVAMPTPADLIYIENLKAACIAAEVPLLDVLTVTVTDFVSLKREGRV